MPSLTSEQSEWVERNAFRVAIVARRVRRLLPEIPVEDLESAGNEGLIQAALRYDPESGFAFGTFAHYRIRGAMLDWVRRENPGMRRHQRALNSLRASQAVLENAARSRRPDCEALEEKVAAARALVKQTAISVMTSRAMDHDPELVPDDGDPEQATIDRQLRARLEGVLERLEPADRELVDALYRRGESMHEIAARLDVATSTISRRHVKLLERLSSGFSD